MKRTLLLLVATAISATLVAQPRNGAQAESEPGAPVGQAWVTTGDRSQLFTQSAQPLRFSSRAARGAAIVIDDQHRMQSIDGFGFALTGGSAEHLINMSPKARTAILQELYGAGEKDIRVNYLRLTLGASDMNSFVFSYNDLPAGEEDFELKKFSLSQDLKDVVPVTKEILKINPDIKIMASPWSAPTWMKTNGKVKGGKLRKECYDVYARYFVKYVQAMAAEGIRIDAVTVQNEPLNSNNTPSMVWTAADMGEFVRDHLGPQFALAGLDTKIVVFDHNLDRPDFALEIYADAEAAKYVDGAAYHHYAGEMTTLGYMHTARPDKHLYFTEQMTTETPGTPTIDIAAQVKRLIINVTGNWSRNVLLWNLAADPLNDPHTDDGGCSMCQGAITIDGDEVSRNIAYYVIAHASKFVDDGSVRIGSTQTGDQSVSLFTDEQRKDVKLTVLNNNVEVMPNVAFRTPEGKTVLIVANDTYNTRSFSITHNGYSANVQLAPGSVGTYVW